MEHQVKLAIGPDGVRAVRQVAKSWHDDPVDAGQRAAVTPFEGVAAGRLAREDDGVADGDARRRRA